MGLSSLVVVLALTGQVSEHASKLPETFKSARFWIETDGHRSGWVLWQVAKGEDRGEACLVVDYERVNYLSYSQRYRMIVRIDERLTPIQFKYGEAWREFRIEKGKIGESPFGAPKDPGNLVSFPELLATTLPFKAGDALKFSTTDHEEKLYEDGSIQYEKPMKWDLSECHVIKASHTTKPGNIVERNDVEFWVRSDRTLAKVASTITWTSGGKKGRRSEVWWPVDFKEWLALSIEHNEMRALAQLSALGDMLLVQRANDFDANSQFDEWTGDISGLYRIISGKEKRPIQVISKELAMADAAPLSAGPEKGGSTLSEALCPKPVPLFGYYFKVLKRFADDGKLVDLNDGSNRHEYLYAICAYPAEYGKTGKKTFLVDPWRTPYWKDLKGKPVEDRPPIPVREGWRTGVLKP